MVNKTKKLVVTNSKEEWKCRINTMKCKKEGEVLGNKGIDYKENKDKTVKIRYGHKMEMLFSKKIISLRSFNSSLKLMNLEEKPYLKFKYDSAIIHSVDDSTYPDRDPNEEVSGWFKWFFYDTNEKGVIMLVAPWVNIKIAIDKNTCLWHKIDDDNECKETEIVANVEPAGIIPYYNIVDIIEDGDNYYPIPHLYCRFNKTSSPFIEQFLLKKALNIAFKEGKPIERLQLSRILKMNK